MTELGSNRNDYLISIAKGILGTLPTIGPMISEVVGSVIPRQRLDRIVEFLEELEIVVTRLDREQQIFRGNLSDPYGIDIAEEGLIQASRAVSADRKKKLALIVGNSLGDQDFQYAEAWKVLSIFRVLSDEEVLWLVFYSLEPGAGNKDRKELINKYHDVLESISKEIGISQEMIDKGAIQDSYKRTLLNHGLINEYKAAYRISSLGKLLVRYLSDN